MGAEDDTARLGGVALLNDCRCSVCARMAGDDPPDSFPDMDSRRIGFLFLGLLRQSIRRQKLKSCHVQSCEIPKHVADA